jgi:hypothetical protein
VGRSRTYEVIEAQLGKDDIFGKFSRVGDGDEGVVVLV